MRSSFVLSSILALLAVLPPLAGAQNASDYAFQVNVAATARTWEDTSVVQFSIRPQTKAAIRVRGRTLRVHLSANTVTNGGSTTSTLRYARLIGIHGAFVDRPLTAAERLRWTGRLVWIDGDVLAVAPANPLCAQGLTLAAARELLRSATSGRLYAPAGLTGAPEHLFDLHAATGKTSGYGPAVRIVSEGSAIGAVASGPTAVAAVAWSAARASLAAGAVCAVPIAGVAPSEATLRDGSYPATVPVSFVWERKPRRFGLPAYDRRWYLGYLKSAKIRGLLATSRGRDRLLP